MATHHLEDGKMVADCAADDNCICVLYSVPGDELVCTGPVAEGDLEELELGNLDLDQGDDVSPIDCCEFNPEALDQPSSSGFV